MKTNARVVVIGGGVVGVSVLYHLTKLGWSDVMLLAERAKHRYMGLETEIVSPDEIRKLAPTINTDGIIGALYDPLDGHLDPSAPHMPMPKPPVLAEQTSTPIPR